MNSRLAAAVLSLVVTAAVLHTAMRPASPFVTTSGLVSPFPAASEPAQQPPPSAEDYARALARIAYLEDKLETCKGHHLAAYTAAWELYDELMLCRAEMAVCETADIPEDSENPWLMHRVGPEHVATPELAP